MNSNLLLSKLRQPALPTRYLKRPFLINHLQDGLDQERRLTLVSAPAGFGKTTCVVEWVNRVQLPAAWLSLDEADDEPGRFFSYLIAALQESAGSVGQEIEPVLKAGQLPPQEIISAALINDLLNLENKILLVIDDFQVIQDNFILKGLQTIVANLPPALHLVLLTREEPSLPLARLRANNQLTEIRAADLRFSSEETNSFLREVMDLFLSQSDISLLAEKTEGWVVGLQLAGLSIRDRSDPSAFIHELSGSHRHILSYLMEEVLNRQPDEIQDFLLQTSILDKLHGELCDAVTGQENARSLLEQLYAVGLIETHAMEMLMAWHAKTLKGWMKTIPPEWAAKSPKTNLAFAWMYGFSGNFNEALPYLQRLQSMFSGDKFAGFEPEVQAEWLAMQSSALTAQGKVDESLVLAEQALSILPAGNAYVQSLIYSVLAINYKQMNDYHRAVEAYQKIIEYGRRSNNLSTELLGIAGLAIYAMERGELRFAFDLATQGVERVERSRTLPPISGAVYGELGGIYYHWYEVEKGHHFLARADQVSALTGYSDAEIYHHVIYSRLAYIDGDLETAMREIQAAVGMMAEDAPVNVREEVIAQQIRIALAQDQSAAAAAVLSPMGLL